VVEHVRAQPPPSSLFTHLEGIHSERVSEAAGGRLSLIDELKIRLASELNYRQMPPKSSEGAREEEAKESAE